jgi:hypothetical protein
MWALRRVQTDVMSSCPRAKAQQMMPMSMLSPSIVKMTTQAF